MLIGCWCWVLWLLFSLNVLSDGSSPSLGVSGLFLGYSWVECLPVGLPLHSGTEEVSTALLQGPHVGAAAHSHPSPLCPALSLTL